MKPKIYLNPKERRCGNAYS